MSPTNKRSTQARTEPGVAGSDAGELGRLLRLVAAGDRAAFACFYDLTAPRVFGVVSALLAAPQAREQLTERDYLRVWRTAGSFTTNGEDPIRWLVRVACEEASSSRCAQRQGRPVP